MSYDHKEVIRRLDETIKAIERTPNIQPWMSGNLRWIKRAINAQDRALNRALERLDTAAEW